MSRSAEAWISPLSGSSRVWAAIVLGFASFMNILDMSIANVSVPAISGDLGVAYSQGTWVITSFAVAEAIMLPLTGWLALRFGQVRMFTIATLLFTLASLACGLAPSFMVLLIARITQGAVGASMIPLSQTLMLSLFPPQKRGIALGLWSMTIVLAPITGPVVGGWLTDSFSWHWIFLINLPFGLIVSGVVWMLMKDQESERKRLPVDYVGLLLLIVGIGTLQILLDRGNELDWFNSPLIIGLASTSFIALAYFVVWELTEAHPVVDLRLFSRRNFTIGTISLMMGSMVFFGTVVLIPLWLQSYQGYTALWAGKTVAFGGVLALMLGPLVGANLHRIDARIIVSFGFIVFASVSFWSSQFTPDVDYWSVALSRLFMGIGISCFFMPLTAINLSGLPQSEIASASGVTNFMRNLGSSFGTAIMVSLWEHKAIAHHAVLVEHVTDYDVASTHYLATLKSLGFTDLQALASLNNTINAQSYLMATNEVQWLCGWLMLSLVLLVWWARPPFTVRSAASH